MSTFEIFRGHYRHKDAVCLETLESLEAARYRMNQIAAAAPGTYFVFSVQGRMVLATVDTTMTNRRAKGAGAS